MSQPRKFICFDIESTGLSSEANQLHGVGVLTETMSEPIYYRASEIPDYVRVRLADPDTLKIGANLRFDARFMIRNGYPIGGKLADIQHMALLVNENRRVGLKELSTEHLGEGSLTNKGELDLAMKSARVKNIADLCQRDIEQGKWTEVIARYCVEDVHNTYRLFEMFERQLKAQHKEIRSFNPTAKTPWSYFLNEMIPTESVLLDIELRGVSVNLELLEEVRKATLQHQAELHEKFLKVCAPQIAEIEEELAEKIRRTKKTPEGKAAVLAGDPKRKTNFNIGSGPQVGNLFYRKFGVPLDLIKRTDNGGFSLDETHLQLIKSAIEEDDPLHSPLSLYQEHKKLQKVVSTNTGTDEKGIKSFIRPDGSGHRIYPHYPQRTVTGRLSSRDPNFQNLPADSKISEFFIPSPGSCFVYADLSQIELCNAAHLSKDPVMLDVLKVGGDLHIKTASRIFRVPEVEVTKVQRQAAKTVNYLLIYNGSAGRLRQELSDTLELSYTLQQCEEFRRAFFELYSVYHAYIQQLLRDASKSLFVLAENGRRRHLPDLQLEKFIDDSRKTFFGPLAVYKQLLEHPGERPSQRELYWRARGRLKRAQNQATNAPNQSIGATAMKTALRTLHSQGAQIAATIHDAVIVECPIAEASLWRERVQDAMQNSYPGHAIPIVAKTKVLRSFRETDVLEG
jgi:DNA polymerase I-like protein with 3'-5' exonuclease and polymerase domains